MPSLKERLNNKINNLVHGQPGEIGKLNADGSFTVRVEGTQNEVWVRLDGDSNRAVPAINNETAYKARLPVRVTVNTSGRYEVIKVDPLPALAFLGEAAPSANIPPLIGDAIHVILNSDQFKPGRVRGENGLDLQIRMEELPYPEKLLGGADTIFDLTTAVAAIGSSKKAWVVISVDPATNVLSTTNGADADPTDELTWADACAIAVPSGEIPLASYMLQDGDTVLPNRPVALDQYFYVDLRPWLTLGSAGGGSMTDFTVAGDSGTPQTISDTNTLTIAGGTGLSSVASATDTVTVNLDNTAVTPASYTNAGFTVDAQGRLTAASSGTASPWTTDSNVVNLVTDADTVTIGSATAGGKLFIDGDADEVQLQIQGNATQTALPFVLENSAGTDQITFSNTGAAVFNEAGNDADFRVEGDTNLNLLVIDASKDAIAVGKSSPNDAAILDLDSTTKAFSPPRMTTAQRNAIASPYDGLIIHNTSTFHLNAYAQSVWAEVAFTGLTQTLTNKTIDGGSNTITDLNADEITTGTIPAARLPGMIGATNIAAGTSGATDNPQAGDDVRLWSGGALWLAATLRQFSQTADASFNTSTAENSLLASGQGSATLAANRLRVGTVIRITASGFGQRSSGNVTFRVKLGGTNIVVSATAAPAWAANGMMRMETEIAVRTIGATGTVYGQGVVTIGGGATTTAGMQMVATGTVTIDTTGTLAIDATCQFSASAATNTFTCTGLLIEVVG